MEEGRGTTLFYCCILSLLSKKWVVFWELWFFVAKDSYFMISVRYSESTQLHLFIIELQTHQINRSLHSLEFGDIWTLQLGWCFNRICDNNRKRFDQRYQFLLFLNVSQSFLDDSFSIDALFGTRILVFLIICMSKSLNMISIIKKSISVWSSIITIFNYLDVFGLSSGSTGPGWV